MDRWVAGYADAMDPVLRLSSVSTRIWDATGQAAAIDARWSTSCSREPAVSATGGTATGPTSPRRSAAAGWGPWTRPPGRPAADALPRCIFPTPPVTRATYSALCGHPECHPVFSPICRGPWDESEDEHAATLSARRLSGSGRPGSRERGLLRVLRRVLPSGAHPRRTRARSQPRSTERHQEGVQI